MSAATVRQQGERREWRAYVGDVAVGTATVHRGSDAGACFMRLRVEPGYRRRGAGRELLEARIGLATMVKADLLLALHDARPDLRSVAVTCAVANEAIRALNHRLGFREEQRRTLYRLAL